jgi:hypothetical protein
MSVQLSQPLLRRFLLFFATDEAALPSAVRTDFGKCAIVRFLFAADAAFLMFFLAALVCLVEVRSTLHWLPFGQSFDAASHPGGSFETFGFASLLDTP